MTSTEFLDHLPSITTKVALYRVDSAGMVLEHSGCADSAEFEVQGSRLGVELPAGRDSRSWLLPKGKKDLETSSSSLFLYDLYRAFMLIDNLAGVC